MSADLFKPAVIHRRYNSQAPSPAMESTSAPAPVMSATRWQRIFAYRVLLLLVVLVFALDQLTKAWIAARLPFGTYPGAGGIVMIPNFFYLIHVGNTGAAWSLLTGKSTLLALLALGTLGAIFLWRRALGLRLPIVQVSFGLLCGGILGNLVDRLRHGHVIDFIDLHFGNYIYPTFNIADSGICVGVVIFLFWSLRQPD